MPVGQQMPPGRPYDYPQDRVAGERRLIMISMPQHQIHKSTTHFRLKLALRRDRSAGLSIYSYY